VPDSVSGQDERPGRTAADLWTDLEQARAVYARVPGAGGSDVPVRASREAITVHYTPLVRYVAARIRSGMPGHIDAADLVSAGFVGLLTAIESFDVHRGVPFESYAVPRIRGAMLDEMRSWDWAPRSLRRRAREIDSAISELSVRRGRAPSDAEIADRLGVTPVDLHDTLNRIAFADVVALTGRDESPEVGAPDPLEAVEQWGVRQEVVNAVHRLPVRERIVVALYYWEGFTMAQIAEVLDVSESRASQLHTSAVQRLRPWMLARAS